MDKLDYCRVAQSLDGIKQSLIKFKIRIFDLDDQYQRKIHQLDAQGLDKKSMNKIYDQHFSPSTHLKVHDLAATIDIQLHKVESLLQAYTEMCRKQNGGQ